MNTQPINIQFVGHLTENYQLQAADKLISKLKTDLAANECYIEELEEQKNSDSKKIENLEKQVEELKISLKKLNDKYSMDVNQFIKTDILYSKYKTQIEELKIERDSYKSQRDKLAYQLCKLQQNV